MKQAIKTKPALKYKLKELFGKLDAYQNNLIKSRIIEDTGITRSTLWRHENIKFDETADIPAVVLKSYAKNLGVAMEALFN